MYKQFRIILIIITCKIMMIIQVNAGGKMKVKTNADKKNRNMNAEEEYGKYLTKKYSGSRHMGLSGSRDVDSLGWGYGTHLTPLVTAVLRTKGDVLELGTGDFSTPILDSIISTFSGSRKLYSTDGNLPWLKEFANLETSWHIFKHVDVFDNGKNAKLPLPKWMKRKWSVVLIDQSPAQRRRYDIKRLRKLTEVFVVHDTSEFVEHIYKLKKILSKFKYSYIYPRYTRSTTIVSDTIDVRKWFANVEKSNNNNNDVKEKEL